MARSSGESDPMNRGVPYIGENKVPSRLAYEIATTGAGLVHGLGAPGSGARRDRSGGRSRAPAIKALMRRQGASAVDEAIA